MYPQAHRSRFRCRRRAARAVPCRAVPLDRQTQRTTAPTAGAGLVSIVVGLEWTVPRHSDVGGLLGGQRRELTADGAEGQPCDLAVEVVVQHLDALLVLVVLRTDIDLGDRPAA